MRPFSSKSGQASPRLLMFCWPSSAQTGNKRFEGLHPTTMNMDSRNWNRIGLQAALLVLLSLTTTSHGRTSSSNSCYARDHKGDSSDSDSEDEYEPIDIAKGKREGIIGLPEEALIEFQGIDGSHREWASSFAYFDLRRYERWGG